MKYSTGRVSAGAAIAGSLIISIAVGVFGENIFYPEGSRVVDVTKLPYEIDNSGGSDVTAELQRAIDENQGWKVIYLPNGTYQVSNTIRWKDSEPNNGPVLQGQSIEGTIIKLKSGAFTGSDAKAVLWTGSGVAQNFNKGIHNLTVHVEANNPAAVGVQFYGNNESLMSDVKIVSADGNGKIGLELNYGGEQGPCGVRDITVVGFDIGVELGGLNSVTAYNITVENQNQVGCLCAGGLVALENFKSTNSVRALQNNGGVNLALIHAELGGGDGGIAAIRNEGILYARDITAEGYSKALEHSGGSTASPGGMTVEEFNSHGVTSLFDSSPKQSLGLPVKPLPVVEWDQNPDNWATIEDYKGGGLGEPRRSNVGALHAAMDDGKTGIVIPYGKNYVLEDTLRVRGDVRHLTGGSGALGEYPIVIEEGSGVVVLSRLMTQDIIQRSSRPVVIEQCNPDTVIGEGSGDVFVFDACGLLRCSNPAQSMWCRQLNAESMEGNDIVIEAGRVWMLGWKSEHAGTKVIGTGGCLEVLGMLLYSPCGDHNYPLFDITNTAFSVTPFRQINYCGSHYNFLVKETRGGETKTLKNGENYSGYSIPMYTGYAESDVGGCTIVKAPVSTATRTNAAGITFSVNTVASGNTPEALRHMRWSRCMVFDVRGAVVGTITRRQNNAGLSPRPDRLEGPEAIRFLKILR